MRLLPGPRRWRRSIALLALGTVLVLAAALGASELWVGRVASARCFASLPEVPEAPAALLLGCSERLPDGRRNLYFERRIAAAAELFHAGKVRAVIVSGDNSRADYDEPAAMHAALVRAGVPSERVVRDCAGFRTLDSIVRARAVFGQARVIVVSQRFHCERAVFLARAHGLEAFGYAARAVGGPAGLRTRLRETAARAAAVLDVTVLGTAPRFLGPPIEVPLPPG